MEHFSVTKTDTGFQIEGFPEAVKVVYISGPKARRLADLALHKADLDFAGESLEAINLVPGEPYVIRQALWRSAIVHFLKCFGVSNARFSLAEKKIYKGNAAALEAFRYFDDLRNKHVVHDENSYTQCLPGAILNKKDHDHKIEKIICFSAIGETLEQENYENLHLLIEVAKKWVVDQFNKLCEILTEELEAESYDALHNREPIVYKKPTVEDVDKPRPIP